MPTLDQLSQQRTDQIIAETRAALATYAGHERNREYIEGCAFLADFLARHGEAENVPA